MSLYFIGGASGSGKTSVMPHLKELLKDGIAVYDFDDIGVPEGADKKWRGESTEKWLQKLLSEGKDGCLLGQIVLGEILSSPSAKQIDKINFCLLDVSDFERIRRLKTRLRQCFVGQERNTDLSTEAYRAQVDQNMLNWSAWLRMHHLDPQWVPHVIQEDAASNMDFSKLSSLKSYEEVANVKILDTTDIALDEVAEQLADWVRSFDLGPFHVVKVQPHELSVIEDKITSYNNSKVPFIQEQPFINLNFCIKDESGVIIAGITSVMYCWGMLFVDILAVDEKHYKNGLGSKLLSHVENEAKKLGATLAHLDTFDFQAKDFYIKHGYEVFGILDDCPKGHKRYYMKKVL
jgi:GNAT superfamily N-acetyltransferase